jgi:hypothetical protein
MSFDEKHQQQITFFASRRLHPINMLERSKRVNGIVRMKVRW